MRYAVALPRVYVSRPRLVVVTNRYEASKRGNEKADSGPVPNLPRPIPVVPEGSRSPRLPCVCSRVARPNCPIENRLVRATILSDVPRSIVDRFIFFSLPSLHPFSPSFLREPRIRRTYPSYCYSSTRKNYTTAESGRSSIDRS